MEPDGARRSLTPWVWALVFCVFVMRSSLRYSLSGPAVENWSTIFLSLTLQAFPFLVLGVVISAIVSVLVLAVVLSICSEADAFVAAGLTQFSLTSRLVFLVVGPMVDLKLISLQAGTFGRRFVMRFAPLTLSIAVLTGLGVGSVLL